MIDLCVPIKRCTEDKGSLSTQKTVALSHQIWMARKLEAPQDS